MASHQKKDKNPEVTELKKKKSGGRICCGLVTRQILSNKDRKERKRTRGGTWWLMTEMRGSRHWLMKQRVSRSVRYNMLQNWKFWKAVWLTEVLIRQAPSACNCSICFVYADLKLCWTVICYHRFLFLLFFYKWSKHWTILQFPQVLYFSPPHLPLPWERAN